MARNAASRCPGRDRVYRYTIERIWNPDVDPVLFIMLNPSTADAGAATTRRCTAFAAG